MNNKSSSLWARFIAPLHARGSKESAVGSGFLIICFCSLLLLFTYLHFCISIDAVSVPFKILSCLADAMLITFPFLFLRKWWKILFLPVIYLFAILIFANIIYFHNFGDLIAPSLYTVDISDDFILQSSFASLKWNDLLILAGILIPTIYPVIFGWRKSLDFNPGVRYRVAFSVSLIIVWGLHYAGEIRRERMFGYEQRVTTIFKSLFKPGTASWQDQYRHHNFSGYLILSGIKAISVKYTLTSEERSLIAITLRDKYHTYDANKIPMDAEDRPVNLILIVVESLSTSAFDLPGGEVFMPNLTRLASDTANIFIRECKVLARLGRSSDAQFAINTGLLPLQNEALVSNYASGDYPALAKAFPGRSMEIIGEYSSLWSHGLTSKSYGFDYLVSGIGVHKDDQDRIIFQRSLEEIAKVGSPLFILISSISMHNPYLKSIVSDKLPKDVEENFPDHRDREYLRRLLHFDSSLGEFIEALKKMDKFDNSLIVIVGDHEIAFDDISSKFHQFTVPLIILNSGMETYRSQGVTQLDIFPSILQVMGLDYRYERFGVPYSGLGKSIFVLGDEYNPSEDDYHISELIIRSID